MIKNELKSLIVRKGLTQAELAKMLNMSAKTFSTRLKSGIFGTDEVVKMIKILDITNPADIFLSEK